MALVRVTIPVGGRLRTLLSEKLLDAGAPGLQEEPGALVVYASDTDELQRFLEAVSSVRQAEAPASEELGEPEQEPIDHDYHQRWLEALEPSAVTDRLVFRPTHAAPAPPEEQTLWFEPKVSFGAGDHPTTQLAARHLELLGQVQPGATLLDVGTGSGVLALVALRSGFSRATAIDIEEEALASAMGNARLNGLEQRLEVRPGSAGDLSQRFSVVVANIISSVLLSLASHLAARVEAEGQLLLTGLLEEEAAELESHFQSLGLELLERRNQQGWSLLVLRRT